MRTLETETIALSIRRPLIEFVQHEALYNLSPETHVVAHTHSPNTVAMSVLYADRGDIQLLATVGMTIGRVPIVVPARQCYPWQDGIFAGEGKGNPKNQGAVIARHGPVAGYGKLDDGYNIVGILKHNCRVAWLVGAGRTDGVV